MEARHGALPPDFTAQVQDALNRAEDHLAQLEKSGFKYAHGSEPGSSNFAKRVDHTILKPETTEDALFKVCDEAKQWGFKTVCVRPNHVAISLSRLQGTDVQVCSVVCFPEGTQSTQEKVSEAQFSLKAGAVELDFVINYPLLLARSYDAVYEELCTIVQSVGSREGEMPKLKLILETSQLARIDIVAAGLLASKAGFDFIKTSTGFLGHGARVEDVRLMREVCEMERGRMQVKASGGIRTAQDARAMLDAGAGRLGLSGSVSIMEGVGARSSGTDTGSHGGY